MDPRQSKLLFVLVAVFLVLLALLTLSPNKDLDETDERVLGPLAPDAIDRITLTNHEGVLEAHRRTGSWILTKPHPGIGDSDVLDSLVRTVGRWQITDRLDDANPEEHGLSTTAHLLSVVLLDGAAPKLQIGDVAPGGAHTYARFADGPVLVLDGDVRGDLSRPLDLYRDRRLHGFLEDDIVRVDWMLEDVFHIAIKEPAAGWTLDGAPTSPGHVESFLAVLAGTRLESFQDELTLEEAALSPPRGRLVLSGPRGEAEILVGGPKLGGVLVRTADRQLGTIGSLEYLFP